jgi:hypothetical protein
MRLVCKIVATVTIGTIDTRLAFGASSTGDTIPTTVAIVTFTTIDTPSTTHTTLATVAIPTSKTIPTTRANKTLGTFLTFDSTLNSGCCHCNLQIRHPQYFAYSHVNQPTRKGRQNS